MKKNLRNILALSLALMTTVSFAQDWNVDSRTRIDMSGDNDRFEAAERANLGVTWEGDDWGIHISTVVNYDMNAGEDADLDVNEAYASTDLMGFASLTVGRQALNYGSGMIVGSNDWAANPYTRDAFVFGLGLDMADVTLGYASRMDGDSATTGNTGMWANVSKAQDDWSVNLLYVTQTATAGDVDGDAETAMGIDLGYEMMDGALTLNASYNTATSGDVDYDMNSVGATYSVNDDMSINATYSQYGENGFMMAGSNWGANGYDPSYEGPNSWMTHGNMGFLSPDDVDLAIGGTYTMGDFEAAATMHTVTNDEWNWVGEDGTTSDYDRTAMNISLGYTMTDNANLSLNYANDKGAWGEGEDSDDTYMWITLNIRP
jgi:hypothetical protein